MNSIIVLLLLSASVASAQTATSKAADKPQAPPTFNCGTEPCPWWSDPKKEVPESFSFSDGCNTTSCQRGGMCVSTLMACIKTESLACDLDPMSCLKWDGKAWTPPAKSTAPPVPEKAKPKPSVKKKAPIQGICRGSIVPSAGCFPDMPKGVGDYVGEPDSMKPCGADEVCVIGPDTPDTAVIATSAISLWYGDQHGCTYSFMWDEKTNTCSINLVFGSTPPLSCTFSPAVNGEQTIKCFYVPAPVEKGDK